MFSVTIGERLGVSNEIAALSLSALLCFHSSITYISWITFPRKSIRHHKGIAEIQVSVTHAQATILVAWSQSSYLSTSCTSLGGYFLALSNVLLGRGLAYPVAWDVRGCHLEFPHWERQLRRLV